MIIFYGTRFYGEVDRRGGQRQLTKFFHVYFVPLVPVQTLWVTQDVDQGYRGHDAAMSVRSVVAGYARVWGPLAAVFALFSGGVGGVVASGALAALSAWTWTWRSIRGAREARRSDFHLFAFGTRCDPFRMDDLMAHRLQADVAERWSHVAEGQTPEDVARRGAANPVQAVLAYASLRLAARLAPPGPAGKAREASERALDLLDGAPLALEGGPYRAGTMAALPAPAERRLRDEE